MLLLILPIVAYAVNDYFFFGYSWWFYGITAWRVALMVYTLLLCNFMRSIKAYRSYDSAAFIWGLVAAFTLVALAGMRPHNYLAHVIVAVVAVFIFLLIIPNRFINQIIISAAIILGEVAIIAQNPQPQSRQVLFVVVLTLFVAPLVALLSSWQFHLFRRRAFIAGEREREAEEALRDLSQRLTYHVDNSPLAVIEWGPDMRLTRWSGEAERIFGWKAEEVLGKRMEDFRWIYQEDQAQVAEVSDELQTGTNPRRFSANRNYRKDGSVVHCEWYNSSLVDESGQLRSILSLVLDVTERKQVEEALRESEKLFRSFFEHSLDAMFLTIPDGRVLDANQAACTMFGRSKEEFLRLGRAATPTADARQNTKAIEQRARTGSVHCEMTYLRKDGTPLHTELSSVILHDVKGEERSFVILHDITKRKWAEEALRASERRERERAEELETVLDVAPVAIWISHDPLSHAITGNRMANAFYEAEPGENVSANVTPLRRFFHAGRELAADELPMQVASLTIVTCAIMSWMCCCRVEVCCICWFGQSVARQRGKCARLYRDIYRHHHP